MNDYLSLGSVVRIKDSTIEIMIIGYFTEDENGVIYTYLGVDAASGISLEEKVFFFNDDMVSEVLHNGFSNEESDAFRKNLYEYMHTPIDQSGEE